MIPMTDRAFSTTVNYVLSLAIVAALIGGLILSATAFVDGQRDRVADDQLRVLGDRLAGTLVDVDAVVQSPDDTSVGSVAVTRPLPDRVAGEPYRIDVSVAGTDPYRVTLRLWVPGGDPDVTVVARSTTPVTGSTVDGGAVVVRYDGGADEVVVEDA